MSEPLLSDPRTPMQFPPRKTIARTPKQSHRWLIVVARDEDVMHAKFRRIFSADRNVCVIFDRRADDSRNRPWLNRSLRIHGFAIVAANEGPRESPTRTAALG
jgi:hypothetical protein